MLRGSMSSWGLGWYSDKVRSKVKLGRQTTDEGLIQRSSWPGTGVVMRKLQVGKPAMCAYPTAGTDGSR